MESNDSPEIPDRGETSDIPGLPSGGIVMMKTPTLKYLIQFSDLPHKKCQVLQVKEVLMQYLLLFLITIIIYISVRK